MTIQFDPFARLRVWSPLSPHEESLVKQTLCDPQCRLKEISRHIQRLESELESLRRQEAALNRVVHASQGLRAPIRSLPLELLLEVFSHCTETLISCSDPAAGDILNLKSDTASSRLQERAIKTQK